MTEANRKQHSLKRIAPGHYETANGKWEIVKIEDPRDGQIWWYFRCTAPFHDLNDVSCWYGTKWEAVEAMHRAQWHCRDNGLNY